MDDLQASTERTLKQLQQEGLEIGKLSPAAAGPGKRQPRSDHQGTEQLHGAHPFIPIRDVEGYPDAAALVALPAWLGPVFSSSRDTTSPCAANAWAYA